MDWFNIGRGFLVSPFLLMEKIMGLFSGETITYLGTSIQRLVEDKLLPNSLKEAVLGSVLHGTDITEAIQQGFRNSMGVKLEQMYKWCIKNYKTGLPEMYLVTSGSAQQVIEGNIENITGKKVDIEYAFTGQINPLHIGWVKLTNDYGYDSTTNEIKVLSNQKKTPVYLKNMIISLSPQDFNALREKEIHQYGIAPSAGYTYSNPFNYSVNSLFSSMLNMYSPPRVDVKGSTSYILVLYEFKEKYTEVAQSDYKKAVMSDVERFRAMPDVAAIKDITVERERIVEGSMQLSFDGYDLEADYVQARYTDTSSVWNVTKDFTLADAGKITEIITPPVNKKSQFFTYKLRSGIYPNIDAYFYKNYQKLGEFFPFIYVRDNKVNTYDQKGTQLYKDTNKILKYIGMKLKDIHKGIIGNNNVENVEQVLIAFGLNAVTENPLEIKYLFDFFLEAESALGASAFEVTTTLPLSLNPTQDKMSIVIQDSKTRIAVNCSRISVKVLGGSPKKHKTYWSGSGTEKREEDWEIFDQETQKSYIKTEIVEYPFLSYLYQASEKFYYEIRVFNLKTSFMITGINNFKVVGREGIPIAFVPLSHKITKNYKVKDREELYGRSLHVIINSRMEQHLKWYESGFFADLLKMINIGITIYSLVSGFTSLAAGLSNASIGSMTTSLLSKVLIEVTTRVLLSVALKRYGVNFGLLVSIGFLASQISYNPQLGTLKLPSIDELLKLMSNISDGFNAGMQGKFKALQLESETYKQKTEDLNTQLKSIDDLLNSRSGINPYIIFGETPEEFYNRSVHAGNIGTSIYDYVSNYVEIALALPKPQYGVF